MAIYCHICASTKGPFLTERFPSSVTSHPSLISCQSCASEWYYGVTVGNKAQTKVDFAYHFLECNNCKVLFYSLLEGVPCAQSVFEVDNCPQCGKPFAPIGEVYIHKDRGGKLSVLSFRPDEQALADVKALYDMVVCAVPQHPNLAAVIREIMLVRAKGGYKSREYEIWIVHIATKRGTSIISHILQKAMEKTFFSHGERDMKFAQKEKGLEFIESIKV